MQKVFQFLSTTVSRKYPMHKHHLPYTHKSSTKSPSGALSKVRVFTIQVTNFKVISDNRFYWEELLEWFRGVLQLAYQGFASRVRGNRFTNKTEVIEEEAQTKHNEVRARISTPSYRWVTDWTCSENGVESRFLVSVDLSLLDSATFCFRFFVFCLSTHL